MADKQAIGVCDLGASGGRFFLVYEDQKRLVCNEVYRFSHSHLTYFQTDASGVSTHCRPCWDMGRLYKHLLEGIKRLSRVEGVRLASFGIDTWGSDGMWMTGDGDVLGLVATGRDARWQQARIELFKKLSPYDLFRMTGIQSHPFNVINQLYWYSCNEPRLVDAAAVYMPVHSLLYYYLTGQRIAEYTWLSTTQLCSAGQPDYSESIFKPLGLPQSKMPTLTLPGTPLGRCQAALAESLGVPPFDIMLPAVHDTACSYAVADCQIDGSTMVISTGTWFLAGAKLSAPLLSKEAFEAGFSNEAGCDSVRFLKNVMGSWPAQQLKRQWSRRENREINWSEFETLLFQGNAFNCVLNIDHPLFFDAENMEKAVLAYCSLTGQRPPQTPADIGRAIYEAIALKVALTAEMLGKIRGVATEEILVVGGVAQSPLLNQWIANASKLPVRTGSADATAHGNAAIQAVRLGWVDSVKEAAVRLNSGISSQCTLFEPQNQQSWHNAYQQLKGMMKNETV